MPHWQLVESAEDAETRNDAFVARHVMRNYAVQLSLIPMFWQPLNARPQYPTWFFPACGSVVAVLVLSKCNRRALCTCSTATPMLPMPSGCSHVLRRSTLPCPQRHSSPAARCCPAAPARTSPYPRALLPPAGAHALLYILQF